GKSINEGLNRGQIAGAFAQGLGWLTMEDLRYAANGALLSHSPTTYKIPGIYDLPADFKIDLLENENTVNVRGSKAVGEPPLLLGISVWTAVKHALSFVSGDAIPVLNTPASGEEILERLTAYCETPASDTKPRSRWGGDGSILLRGQSFAHGESRTSSVRAASVAAKKQ
ncbi:MAG TPA: molybdopterin-dependent oxidoreductase, partial [Candidatus Obscuribacter sp.]|nr:molybdopterin-dependent oxidoreductase [Candidatus Obscuribacter sp.]